MPAQKRSLPDNFNNNNNENYFNEEEAQEEHQNGLHHHHSKQSRLDPSVFFDAKRPQDEQELDQDEDDDDNGRTQKTEDEDEQKDDSEGSESSSSEDEDEDDDEKPEFVFVELPEIRKDVQCPICLGIIKKTRTVMECLHRFCRECIDKSMRLGNNECPACRTHCASRRSLRDDPNYDALIAAIYPDIEKYEEEELAFHEEERTRNKQIQASIAQIFQRQSEALAKKRMGKETPSPFMTRSQRNQRTVPSRRRRNSRGTEFQGSEDIEEENDDNGGKDSSSADERSTEARQCRRKRRPGVRASQPSSSASNPEGGSIENDLEGSRENRGISPGLVWNTEVLAWGRGGARSHTRHGNSSSCNNKNSRSTRLSKLVEYLRSLEEKTDELDVHLMLYSLEKKSAPSLERPYLYCQPSLSVKHLCEYVAQQTALQSEEVEILLVKGTHKPDDNLSTLHPPISMEELQILGGQETLAGLRSHYATKDRLVLAYRQKESCCFL